MALQDISFEMFPLLTEAAINENTRPGTLMLEYFEAIATIATNAADVEVPTKLNEVLGVISANFSSVFAAADAIDSTTTDGVISSSAVTVRLKTSSIADGALTIRGFLIGRTKSVTTLLNSPV